MKAASDDKSGNEAAKSLKAAQEDVKDPMRISLAIVVGIYAIGMQLLRNFVQVTFAMWHLQLSPCRTPGAGWRSASTST